MKGKLKKDLRTAALILLALLLPATEALAQRPAPAVPRTYPKEIRGYKIERATVEIRRQRAPRDAKQTDEAGETDRLIHFGEPRVARVTPLGITLEVPITIVPVKQGGHVDFLTFEDMVVNGMPVTVDEYQHSFELPNRDPLLLPVPVRLFISAPRLLIGALDEWGNSKEVWPVTGRVYVFGRFKKFLFKFKRAVPIELSLSLANPLRVEKQTVQPASNH